ncbi:MAG: hypothetical protein MJZ21_01760 [archaeon]|nr:hypothetical protein [archaeon]
MALTLVTTAQLGIFTYASRYDLILAIIGMDFVWGAIDMYIFYRGDVMAYHRRLKKYSEAVALESDTAKKDMLRDEFHGTMFEFADDLSRDKILDTFLSADFTDFENLSRSKRHYLFNAITAFFVTMLTVVPSIVALWFFEDYTTALFCSSVVSAFALFFTGYLMAPDTTLKVRVTTGLVTAGIALLFTIFAAYFGG